MPLPILGRERPNPVEAKVTPMHSGPGKQTAAAKSGPHGLEGRIGTAHLAARGGAGLDYQRPGQSGRSWAESLRAKSTRACGDNE